MGFSFRKTVKLGKTGRLNFSKSGVSASKTIGRVTVNSRGRVSINFGKGLTWRSK